MSARKIILSAVGAGLLVTAPLAIGFVNSANATEKRNNESKCHDEHDNSCNSHDGGDNEHDGDDDNEHNKGKLSITKIWIGGEKDYSPTYKVICEPKKSHGEHDDDDDEDYGHDSEEAPAVTFIGTETYLEGLSFTNNAKCTIQEVPVAGNGWIEDPAVKQVKFSKGDHDEKDGKDDEREGEGESDHEHYTKGVTFTNYKPSLTKTAYGYRTWSWDVTKSANGQPAGADVTINVPVGCHRPGELHRHAERHGVERFR